jgi:hypothetical protein
MTDFAGLLRALADADVEFIIVGGLAATIHGSSRLTQDIDVVYERSNANLQRLANALRPLEPRLRAADPDLPFDWSTSTLKHGLNFTLTTTLGDIDVFGEISGGGTYANLKSHTIEVELFGLSCLCLDLASLIRVKRAAGRRKDLDVIAELEAIAEEQQQE